MASGVDAKLLRTTKFPPEFNQKVDMQKVNLQVMKKWIASRISEILGSEDDVVIELCFNLIEGSKFPDIKALQIQLTGFLDKDTAPFCKELWKLCLSAQTSPQGVPKELLEAKKLELIQEKIEADRAADEARRRREDTERRDSDLNRPRDRDRDRGDRNRGRGGGDSWRGRRGDRNNDQRVYGHRTGEPKPISKPLGIIAIAGSRPKQKAHPIFIVPQSIPDQRIKVPNQIPQQVINAPSSIQISQPPSSTPVSSVTPMRYHVVPVHA
ncbi:PWI domain-containing protein [Colletotrichum sidae]|uniref:PWI domain-containing protein n=1 Tax=Colletotrichum sidae TaxID=1347389 RepID=A0A4R8TNQ8_9PEZI|nr:PWI domain-containing protein [Colletotrichum sidae]